MPARVLHHDLLDEPRPVHLQTDDEVDEEDDEDVDDDDEFDADDEEENDQDEGDTERWQVAGQVGLGPGRFA